MGIIINPYCKVAENGKLDKTEYLARLKEIKMDKLAKDLEIKEAERNLKEREKIDNVLKIPLEAIIESEGKRYVFVVKGNKVTKREIKTGLENAMEACIISGVYENEKIVLNPPQDLNDKDTVVIKD
ncbi:MAG: hypothetical protein AB1414_21210 [bacterium]